MALYYKPNSSRCALVNYAYIIHLYIYMCVCVCVDEGARLAEFYILLSYVFNARRVGSKYNYKVLCKFGGYIIILLYIIYIYDTPIKRVCV